jgi:HSP20 family protein
MKRKKTFERGNGPLWTEPVFSSRFLFDDFFTRDGFRRSFDNSGVTTPAVNIIETPVELLVEMVAPGMKKEAFKVELQEAVLTISYDHQDNMHRDRKDFRYRLREYNYHSFMRSFYLPDTVESDAIKASYNDGILSLHIPKKKEAITRRIDIM